ncbi:MAG: hypothetical protein K6C94_01320 [Candidatus Gastranaerophilales bacterium]|nr:hypothetical protein [Candidatus Gastranaerophilales bacterium]
MKIAYSFGALDLVHIGHINALKKAKSYADKHIFGLVDDDTASEWFGQLISNFEERKTTAQSIVYIDEVMKQKTFDPSHNLKEIHSKYPDAEILLCCANSWKFLLPDDDFLKSINCKVQFLPYYVKLSLENISKHFDEKKETAKPKNNIISTKATTLIRLKKILKKATIEDIFVTTENEFNKNKAEVLKKIKKNFKNKIVIRSSSSREDGFEKSNAGYYESILNINSQNDKEVSKAILTVANSYKKGVDDENYDSRDEQILIQSQTENIAYSGVIFTRDIQKNRPYYLINYDDNGSSDSVTSGKAGKSLWITNNMPVKAIRQPWKNLIEAVKEIENILNGIVLDIEFAIKTDGSVVIFQVRPLAAVYKFKKEITDNEFYNNLNNEKKKYFELTDAYTKKPMLWSNMAFWNPAEIIGENPKTLDYSLYKEIITNKIWNDGLVPMGYKQVSHNLMRRFANRPYISLDYSFRSLIPNVLSEKLTRKLIGFYKKKLASNLKLHDKIEFEIVYSCFDFETDTKLQELKDNGFTDNEIKELRKALYDLTLNAVKTFFTVLANDKRDLYSLEITRQKIEKELKNDLNERQLIDYFELLIEGIKLNGTPQFSRQARFAFIAKSLCKTLVSKGYIKSKDMENFMLSVNTVASDFSKDMNLYMSDKMSKDEFLLKYGHLRSGTYDITSKTYSEMDFSSNIKADAKACEVVKSAKLSEKIIKNALKDINFDVDYDHFIEFLRTSFEQREEFKFEFTKSLSLAIEVLARIAEKFDFTREEFANIDVSDIFSSKFYANINDLKEFWQTLINQRKIFHEKNTPIVLPDVILDEYDFNMILFEQMKPNFITEKEVTAEIINLQNNKDDELEGKIVLIERADPGFDYIFSKGIKGLITKYGGVASHMAIRCSEFGLPAAIGCGDKIYKEVAEMKNVNLDCKNAKITEVL